MIQLREYQEKIIHDLRRSLSQGHKRVILQMEVGAGKTVVSAEIARLASQKFKRTLFIAPRRQLVYQGVETFQNLGISSGVIMAGERPFSMPMVQVGSIDTLTSRISSGRMNHPDSSMVLCDEAHATFSKARLDFLGKFPVCIGITATPALANGKGMGAFYTDIVQGPTMAEMVAMGFLVPARYYGADAPDLSAVGLNADGDYIEGELAEASDKPELIGGIYENYKRIAGNRSTLIFAVNCKHGRHILETFLDHGVKAEYIDANTPTEERDEMKKRVMAGVTKVIVNIQVMAFGTDWPIISCVIVARVTKNICAWRQMLGRGSRLHPTKEDFIVVYHGHNFDELGALEDPIEWSLDDKTTVKERKQKVQKERKEPKEIKCKCGYIFKSSRRCPSCGLEIIPKGEAIPVHEAELVELTKKEKFTSEYKEQFYRELLGHARETGKKDGWAFWEYQAKFGVEPKWKKVAAKPQQEVLGWVKHRQIAKAKARVAA